MSKFKLVKNTSIALLVTSAMLVFSCKKKPQSLVNVPIEEKHRGVCWVAGPNQIGSDEFVPLSDLNVNWISQTPFGWQRGYDNPEIGTNKDIEKRGYQAWWGERDEGLRTTTRKAKEAGIKTILKPHIWLRDKSGKWRGDIKMKSDADWKQWFEEYTEFILHYAKLAEEESIEMFCIGTELHQTCVEREDNWRLLISKVRKVYSGPLTYAANFSDEFKDILFWDELDYIGVQAYFPLVNKENPSLEEIKAGWKAPIKELARFSDKYEKPILFTEVGYKSTKDSGIEPWQWPTRMSAEETKAIYSDETQMKLYEALFSEVWEQPWLAGFHFWKWYPTWSKGKPEKRNEPALNTDFSPQHKSAQDVMGKWFNKTGN